jgi:hypothetical protein
VVIGKQDAGVDDLEDMDELDLTEINANMSSPRRLDRPARRRADRPVRARSMSSRIPVSTPSRSRDVQSIALAVRPRLDRRIISVVQLGGDAFDHESATGFRSSVVAITAEPNGFDRSCVTLGRDDEESVGFAEGSVATTARHRLVATATVDALRQLEPAAECIDVDHAQILRVGAHDIAVVTVVFVLPPSEQLVSGSAIVRPQQEADAVARAVLDATNRRLAYISPS